MIGKSKAPQSPELTLYTNINFLLWEAKTCLTPKQMSVKLRDFA